MFVNVNRFTLSGELGVIEGYGNQCVATFKDGETHHFGFEDLPKWIKRLKINRSGSDIQLTDRFKEEG